MNCANHADAPAVAYCRTCGKALCANCTRPVRGVIYCEECLGARMEGTIPHVPPPPPIPPLPEVYPPAPGANFAAPSAGAIPGTRPEAIPNPPGTSSGPNPTVAGILAGIFPFGVGPVYNGQYAKGLAYLLVSVLLLYGADHAGDAGWVFGVGFAFFIVYQIVDSVKSARALQLGQVPPDPLGLGQAFGWQAPATGEKVEGKQIPVGAMVLILLGILFLLHTMGLTEFGLDRFWPVVLIALGGWLFARNFGLLGHSDSAYSNPRCRSRRLMGPAVVLTVGVLLLLSTLDIAHFGRTWPILLLVIGAVKLLQGSIPAIGPGAPTGTPPITPEPPAPTAPPVSEEVNRG